VPRARQSAYEKIVIAVLGLGTGIALGVRLI
jgi:hypothetical protein